MWLFTTIGFFSVVAQEDAVLIRARVRDDLDNLRRKHLPDLQIVEQGGPCAYVSRDEWEHAATQLAASVDYPRFEVPGDVLRSLQSS